MPSGTTDPQDFVFEAANDAVWPNPPMPRVFLRKGGEKEGTQTPSFNNAGLGAGLNVSSSHTGYNLYNPITILFNLHLSNGSQISRYNGVEVRKSSQSTIRNIQYAPLDPGTGNRGGGIWYGSNWQGGSQLEGGFGEIIWYDDSKDSPLIETHLANKWGITIPNKKRFLSF